MILAFLLSALLLPQTAAATQPVFACAQQPDFALPAARTLIGPVETPVRGTPRLLVVFARFAGEFPEMTAPPSWSQRMFDAELPGSITHFYDTMSGGLLHVDGEVAPRFYEAPAPAEEYVGSDPLATGPYGLFVAQILEQVDADVDFARFDSDDDGNVDAVAIALLSAPDNFLQGPATGIASLGITGYYLTVDRGTRLTPVRVANDHGSVQVAPSYGLMVATICHEFAHLFGAFDLHNAAATRSDTPPTRDSAGIGAWGLMGWGALGWHGNDGPNPFMAWTRVKFGWADIVDLQQTRIDLQLEDVTLNGKVARVRLPSGDLFLIENRQRESYYDRNIPGEGLLIWHVDPRQLVSVDLEAADGRWTDAGYPLGRRADKDAGADNLDFWAHDVDYAALHAGNLGDGTDPFDGDRFVRFGPETNPASWDLSHTWSFTLDSLRFVDNTALAALTLPPVVRFDQVSVVGAIDGVVVAGERVDIDFVLSAEWRGFSPALVVRLEAPEGLVQTNQAAVSLLPQYVEGGGIGSTSRRCCVYRAPPGDHISFTVEADLPGVVELPLTLVVYEIGDAGLQRLWQHQLELIVVGVRQRVQDVVTVDDVSGNGDALLQAGEVVRFEFSFPDLQQTPQILDGLQLSLRSLDGGARPLESALVAWIEDGTARARSSLWITEAGLSADSLTFELEIRNGDTTSRELLSVAIAEGADPSPPLVGSPVVHAVEGGMQVALPDSRLDDGSPLREVFLEIQSASGEQLDTWPMQPRLYRYQTSVDLPSGEYMVRVVAVDEAGNRGFGPQTSVSVPIMPTKRSANLSGVVQLSQGVGAVAWSPDGGHIAVAEGENVLILDSVTLGSKRAFQGHDRPVTRLRFAGDDALLVSADAGGAIQVWDPVTGLSRASLNVEAPLVDMDMSTSGDVLAVVTDEEIFLWRRDRWSLPWRRLLDSGATAVAVQGDNIAAIGRADGRLHYWDLLLARPSVLSTGLSNSHQGSVSQLRFAGTNTLVTATAAGTVGIWQVRSGSGHKTDAHEDQIVGLATHASADLVASVGWDGELRVARMSATSGRREVLRVSVPGVQSVSFSPDGLQLVAGTWDGELRKYVLGSAVSAAAVSTPQAVTLLAAYPNPFNGGVSIPFRLRRDAPVTARIYNMTGQLVRTLDLPRQLAGDHYAPGNALYWDGTDEQHRDVGSGVYLVQLRVGGFRDTARLVLLR